MPQPERSRWAVVGGGMLGMTAALRLAQAGHEVTIFEAAPELGGLASAWSIGDVTWDRFYHVTLMSDIHTRRLLEELGLDNELQWTQTRTGFYSDKGLYSLSTSLEYLRFPLIGLWGKFRLAATILYASRIKDWRSLERIPVGEWLRKLSGNDTYNRIWLPLLRSKLGDRHKDTSAAFIWTTIARMYAARRSGMKREMFGYVKGGYARTLDRMAARLAETGVTLRRASPVSAVRQLPEGGVDIDYAGGSARFDAALVTAASPLVPRLVPNLSLAEKERLQAIPYLGVVCASVLLSKPLAGFYVTNIVDGSIPFTGVIEMSALVDRSEFRGQSLVYLPKYADPLDPMFEESDESIRERFVSALERMYPAFRRSDVAAFRVARARYVAALPTLNYSTLVPPVETSLPGVFLLNTSQIVNGTLNVNETVRLAEGAMPELLSRCGGTRSAEEVLAG